MNRFSPPKRNGFIVHGIIAATLTLIVVIAFINLTRVEVGAAFLISLLILLAAFAPLPFFAYRLYSLWNAEYILSRDSLALRWGLRVEDIPLGDIEFVRAAQDLAAPLRLPVPALPGGLLGARRHQDLGIVEFLASDAKKLLLVATAKRVFVISPEQPAQFTQTFARAVELGSLTPAESKSVYPSFVVGQAWKNGVARYFWLTAVLLNVGLFAWVSFIIPLTDRVALGAQFNGSALETVPSSQLIIFPLASLALTFIGWVAGLYLYRREQERPLAFILWASSALTGLLFLLAALFVVTTPI
ncbi:MAG: hypothetical protein Fur002_12520 [Anaerolineales bacterium]